MTTHKDHVAVDLDDVTVDFWPGIAAAFAKEYDIVLPVVHPWSDEAKKFYNHELFAASGYKDWWAWLRDNRHLWGKVFEPVPGAIGGIRRLRAAGWYVEAVTSKPQWAERSVYEFIGRYNVPFQGAVIVPPGESKLDWTDAGVIVDDKLQTCIDFNKAGRAAVLFDRVGGHIDDPNLNPFMGHARNWEDVITRMEGFRE